MPIKGHGATGLLPRLGTKMLMLAIDTATRSGSVALLDKGHIVGARYFDTNLEHSRRLFVEIDELLERSAQQAAALDGVAVSVGPGSYTGLRIGLSAAKGLCLASGAALVTVPTLDAIAAGLPYCSDAVCALVGARSGETCWALYDTTDGDPRSLSAPRIDSVPEVLDRLPGAPVVLCGEGAVAFVDLVQDFPHYRCAPEPIGKPQACYVGYLGHAKLMAGDTEDLDSAEPEYLRTPNYETALEQRARKASTAVGSKTHHARR
jgi:tRNA threonylcarbamoyladenosine biosynthesis protein TsaB